MSDDVLLFFAGKPGAAALYRAFEDRVLAEVDGVRIRVQKTQISFYVRHMFAAVSLLPARPKARRPETYITVTIGLRRRLDSPRVDQAAEPYPERWTHHILLADAAEIDDELMSWVREAAVFADKK